MALLSFPLLTTFSFYKSCFSGNNNPKLLCLALICLFYIIPVNAQISAESDVDSREASIELYKEDSTGSFRRFRLLKRQSPRRNSADFSHISENRFNNENDRSRSSSETFGKVLGRFLSSGRRKDVHGPLHLLPTDDCGKHDARGFARLPYDWVAVIHISEVTGGEDDCPLVMDRVRNALMFGASAIIILSLNQVVIRELDAAQIVSKPVVLVDNSENITGIINLLRKIKMYVRINSSHTSSQHLKVPTFTMWSTCGRAPGGRGVVCLEQQDRAQKGKADPHQFWQCFYACILFIVLLTGVKTRLVESVWALADEEMESSLRKAAHQALALMKPIRYMEEEAGGQDSTCAVCLEDFLYKQKLRVLPCLHTFHTRCVDPWLVRARTCPLCKLNIIETSSLS